MPLTTASAWSRVVRTPFDQASRLVGTALLLGRSGPPLGVQFLNTMAYILASTVDLEVPSQSILVSYGNFDLIHNCAKQPDFRPVRRKHSDAFVESFPTESCASHRRAFDRVGRVDAHERHRSWPDTRACQGEPGDWNACSEEQTATTAADR